MIKQNNELKVEKGILTVGTLKNLLAKYDNETQILVASDDYYLNIDEILLPDGDGIHAITLIPNDSFDPRQF